MSDKRAYTPAEFAALFGREKTWTYRMLYAGKINGITDYGKLMIPASEADRIEADAERYRGKKKVAPQKKPKEAEPIKVPEKGSARWSAWVAKKKTSQDKSIKKNNPLRHVKKPGHSAPPNKA